MNIGFIFGLIFAIIVMIFVIVFAGPAIMEMFAAQGELKLNSALNSLGTQINEIYFLSEGSMTEFIIDIPQGILFCFINYNNLGAETSTWHPPDTSIQRMMAEQKYNIWYYKTDSQSGKSIEHLLVDPSFCVRAGAKVYLENKGAYVGVSEPIA